MTLDDINTDGRGQVPGSGLMATKKGKTNGT
ncbi:unnamed protein product [Ectocarpus sp. CCAP 1310/34]|nr:unnamed protein product [Ectocarpus sp. CCAP 1310/34]CAB1099773.1 unnamed protein product [Ectocarpus sp. CCAP 1310/34]